MSNITIYQVHTTPVTDSSPGYVLLLLDTAVAAPGSTGQDYDVLIFACLSYISCFSKILKEPLQLIKEVNFLSQVVIM